MATEPSPTTQPSLPEALEDIDNPIERLLRNLYGLREIQALPGSDERRELHRARIGAT